VNTGLDRKTVIGKPVRRGTGPRRCVAGSTVGLPPWLDRDGALQSARRRTTELDGNCGRHLHRYRRVSVHRLVLSVAHTRSLHLLRVRLVYTSRYFLHTRLPGASVSSELLGFCF